MKKLLPILIALFFPSLALAGSQTFSATGADQYFTVPADVTLITVELGGAGGQNGGKGGRTQGTLAVTPGQSITVIAGKTSLKRDFFSFFSLTTTHTYGGGGRGFDGGGGRSAIRTGSDDLMTAGGGGGNNWNAYYWGVGGDGGGTNGGGNFMENEKWPKV